MTSAEWLKDNNCINFPYLWKEAMFNRQWRRNVSSTDLPGKQIQRIFLNTPFSIQPDNTSRNAQGMVVSMFTLVCFTEFHS